MNIIFYERNIFYVYFRFFFLKLKFYFSVLFLYNPKNIKNKGKGYVQREDFFCWGGEGKWNIFSLYYVFWIVGIVEYVDDEKNFDELGNVEKGF